MFEYFAFMKASSIITGEVLHNLDLRSLSGKESLTCHTCSDMRPQVNGSREKDNPVKSHYTKSKISEIKSDPYH